MGSKSVLTAKDLSSLNNTIPPMWKRGAMCDAAKRLIHAHRINFVLMSNLALANYEIHFKSVDMASQPQINDRWLKSIQGFLTPHYVILGIPHRSILQKCKWIMSFDTIVLIIYNHNLWNEKMKNWTNRPCNVSRYARGNFSTMKWEADIHNISLRVWQNK